MSIETMSWAWNVPVRGTQKLVLLALADWANADGEAWPHVSTIAKRAGVGERAVQDAIAELEHQGFLSRSPQYRDDGGQRGNLFIVGTPPAGSCTGGVQNAAGQEPKEEPPGREEEKKPGKEIGGADDVREVWEHYVRVFNADRQALDGTRRRIIQNALKVRSVDDCKRAINGLRISPFHNGENDRQTKYLGIQYALKGNSQRGESHDERIDKMAALSPNDGSVVALELTRGAEIRLGNVKRHVASGRTFEPRRYRESKQELEEMGYVVHELDAAPWARLERGT